MVNAKAALMRRLDRQLDGHGGTESPSMEVDRVRAIVSRLQNRKVLSHSSNTVFILMLCMVVEIMYCLCFLTACRHQRKPERSGESGEISKYL